MRFQSLEQWLAWQQQLHPKAIDLGLQRVGAVWRRLHPEPLPFPIVTVAGTNGKGSSVVMLEHVLFHAGYSVGAYSSPHLLHYNERIRVNCTCVGDTDLVQAFATVDQARGDTGLTYFEFATLVALLFFIQARVAIAILEVGLGGRLDAVNLFDPQLCLITNVALDHMQWLGSDRETVAKEKAGIMRPSVCVVSAEAEPADSIVRRAKELCAPLYTLNKEYCYQKFAGYWQWQSASETLKLPWPKLRGQFQLRNAAAVCQLVQLLNKQNFSINPRALAAGIGSAYLPGRFQVVQDHPTVIFDVAHNAHAARCLADELADHQQSVWAIFAALQDKDICALVQPLLPIVDTWYPVQIAAPRAASQAQIAAILATQGAQVTCLQRDVRGIFTQVLQAARPEQIILVFGSFYLLAQLWDTIQSQAALEIGRLSRHK